MSENGGWRLSLKPYTYNRSKNKPSAKVQLISPPQAKPFFSTKKKQAAPASLLQKKVPLPRVSKSIIAKTANPNENKPYSEVAGAKKVPSPMSPKTKKAVPPPAPAAKKAKGSIPKNNPLKTSKKKKPSAVKKGRIHGTS